MEQPKVLCVDWDGTLSYSRFWENCDDTTLDPTAIGHLTTFLFRDSQALVQDWMKGFVSSATVVDILAQQFNLSSQALYQELERSCRAMQFADSSIPAKLTRIRDQGVKVVIATDNMDTFTKWTVPSLELELLFDGVLSSPDRGAFKKEVADGRSPFFDLYLNQQGLKPGEAVLLDDNPKNAVVESLNMRFVHITPTNPLCKVLDSFIAATD